MDLVFTPTRVFPRTRTPPTYRVHAMYVLYHCNRERSRVSTLRLFCGNRSDKWDIDIVFTPTHVFPRTRTPPNHRVHIRQVPYRCNRERLRVSMLRLFCRNRSDKWGADLFYASARVSTHSNSSDPSSACKVSTMPL